MRWITRRAGLLSRSAGTAGTAGAAARSGGGGPKSRRLPIGFGVAATQLSKPRPSRRLSEK